MDTYPVASIRRCIATADLLAGVLLRQTPRVALLGRDAGVVGRNGVRIRIVLGGNGRQKASEEKGEEGEEHV